MNTPLNIAAWGFYCSGCSVLEYVEKIICETVHTLQQTGVECWSVAETLPGVSSHQALFSEDEWCSVVKHGSHVDCISNEIYFHGLDQQKPVVLAAVPFMCLKGSLSDVYLSWVLVKGIQDLIFSRLLFLLHFAVKGGKS